MFRGAAWQGTARQGSAGQDRAGQRNMFEPTNEIPYWKMIFTVIKDAAVDTVFTYEQLSKVIGKNIQKNRSSLYKASKELSITSKRMLVSERGKGYRVVEGMDIYKHAKFRHVKARHQITKADFEVTNIDTINLSWDEKNRLDMFLLHNQNVAAALTQRVNRAEIASRYATMASSHAQKAAQFSAEELSKLREMLSAK